MLDRSGGVARRGASGLHVELARRQPGRTTAISLGVLATKLRQWDRQARASVFRGKSTRTDYVYVMDFEDGKIRHMTKIWNSGWAMKELGWA
jgi:hypothetical protein